MNAYETDMGPAGAHGPGLILVKARAQGPGQTVVRMVVGPRPRDRAGPRSPKLENVDFWTFSTKIEVFRTS